MTTRVFHNILAHEYLGYDNTKDSQSNRRQGGHNDKLASTHPDMFQKRGDQKYEIGIMYNKINPKDVDHQQNNDEYQNLREVQSTKNITSTPGQMRLSKMSEEDAATVFESR